MVLIIVDYNITLRWAMDALVIIITTNLILNYKITEVIICYMHETWDELADDEILIIILTTSIGMFTCRANGKCEPCFPLIYGNAVKIALMSVL